jgi:hypothetical protein
VFTSACDSRWHKTTRVVIIRTLDFDALAASTKVSQYSLDNGGIASSVAAAAAKTRNTHRALTRWGRRQQTIRCCLASRQLSALKLGSNVTFDLAVRCRVARTKMMMMSTRDANDDDDGGVGVKLTSTESHCDFHQRVSDEDVTADHC